MVAKDFYVDICTNDAVQHAGRLHEQAPEQLLNGTPMLLTMKKGCDQSLEVCCRYLKSSQTIDSRHCLCTILHDGYLHWFSHCISFRKRDL